MTPAPTDLAPGRTFSFNLIGSLLITALLVSLLAALFGAVQRFLPAWRASELLVALGLVAIEATYVQHVARRERMWLSEGMRYMVVELVALLVLMRLVTLAEYSPTELLNWARGLLVWPLSFFDIPYLAYVGIGLIVGVLGHAFAQDLDELAPREFEGASVDVDGNRKLLAQVGGDRLAALGRLSGRFVGGGFLLLLALALQTVNVRDLGAPGLPLRPGAALAATAYFACGFLLYSQARLALLRSRWRLDGIEVSAQISRRWTLSSLLLVLGVLGGALLLPRSYGVGLFDVIALLLQGVSYLIVLVGYLLITLISLLALIPVLLISLLTGGAVNLPPPTLAPPPPPPPEMVESTPPLLPALIFWACVLFLVGYALMLFGQRHPELARLLGGGLLARLWAALRELLGEVRDWSVQAAARLRELARPAPTPEQARQPRRSLRGLDPRAAVRALYAMLLGRARRQGYGRQGWQTPYEYARALSQQLPEGSQEVAGLTDAYVAAAYSPREPGPEDLRAARGFWLRLRRVLRRGASGEGVSG
jgi:hypothetical protein